MSPRDVDPRAVPERRRTPRCAECGRDARQTPDGVLHALCDRHERAALTGAFGS